MDPESRDFYATIRLTDGRELFYRILDYPVHAGRQLIEELVALVQAWQAACLPFSWSMGPEPAGARWPATQHNAGGGGIGDVLNPLLIISSLAPQAR